MEFVSFPKISRLSRECVITEKIDGSNAQILINDDGTMLVGSRNRWLTADADNFGFARWAHEHAAELSALGPGRHYGEWWGGGIQRGYGLREKRFSLFNVSRWNDSNVPPCCSVVPTLYRGMFDFDAIGGCLRLLETGGSLASPGFMRPEGIVIYHTHSGVLFKKTLEKDEAPKGLHQ